jgi:WSC domain
MGHRMLVRKYGTCKFTRSSSARQLTLPHIQFDESKANLYGSCTQPCAGDPSEMCGNAATLSVYKYNPNKSSGSTTSSSPPPPPPPPAVHTTATSSTPHSSSSSSPPSPPPSSTTANTKTPAGWHYRGCYVDQVNPRSLSGSAMYVGVPMTPSACTDHCTQGGFAIAGTEYAGKPSLSLSSSPPLLQRLTPPPHLTHLHSAVGIRY